MLNMKIDLKTYIYLNILLNIIQRFIFELKNLIRDFNFPFLFIKNLCIARHFFFGKFIIHLK